MSSRVEALECKMKLLRHFAAANEFSMRSPWTEVAFRAHNEAAISQKRFQASWSAFSALPSAWISKALFRQYHRWWTGDDVLGRTTTKSPSPGPQHSALPITGEMAFINFLVSDRGSPCDWQFHRAFWCKTRPIRRKLFFSTSHDHVLKTKRKARLLHVIVVGCVREAALLAYCPQKTSNQVVIVKIVRDVALSHVLVAWRKIHSKRNNRNRLQVTIWLS